MVEWTLGQIEAQAASGGVNRQQAEQLIGEVRRLRAAIRRHHLAINPDGTTRFSMLEDRELWAAGDADA